MFNKIYCRSLQQRPFVQESQKVIGLAIDEELGKVWDESQFFFEALPGYNPESTKGVQSQQQLNVFIVYISEGEVTFVFHYLRRWPDGGVVSDSMARQAVLAMVFETTHLAPSGDPLNDQVT